MKTTLKTGSIPKIHKSKNKLNFKQNEKIFIDRYNVADIRSGKRTKNMLKNWI